MANYQHPIKIAYLNVQYLFVKRYKMKKEKYRAQAQKETEENGTMHAVLKIQYTNIKKHIITNYYQ